MRIKQRSEDFRVLEQLREDVLLPQGQWRVYRVIKRKLTSLEAAAKLAELAGVEPGQVSLAGMKDRQGVTVQHMALRHGKEVRWRDETLHIESVGYCEHELTPEASTGNSFEIVVRGLWREEIEAVRANVPLVREQGIVNYFDDQRFGNLRHRQGWIAMSLMHGEHEHALKTLLCAPSPHDDSRTSAFKSSLARQWGNWSECRDVAGRFRAHHSVFEHLKRQPEDFAGAFTHIATRLRLIHLYAFQSHVWNRAVAAFLRERTPVEKRIVVESIEGPLVFPSEPIGVELPPTFRLPGDRLQDVTDAAQLACLKDALAQERMVPAAFTIDGVPGFQLKGEDRALLVLPRHLRVRPSEPDALNRGMRSLKLRFELPRGSYATLVVKRLLAGATRIPEGDERSANGDSPPGRSRSGRFESAGRPRRDSDSGGRGGRRPHDGRGPSGPRGERDRRRER